MAIDPTPEGARPSPNRCARIAWQIVKAICVAAALVHPIASLLSSRFWLADLISHFQEPALAVTILALAVTVFGHRRLALGLAVLAAFQVIPLVRYSGSNPVPPDAKSPDRLRILMVNVLYENETQHDDLIRLIRAEKPDIVGLVEYTPTWRAGLSGVRAEYPYRMEHPGTGDGIALWFRERPRTIDEPEWLIADRHPVLHATFDFAGRERHLWLVHPTSPITHRPWIAGNSELDAIARRVGGTAGSRIVTGDMNSTDGSAHFGDFLRVSGLRDSRLGFGRQGSWPTDMSYRLAIDHAFLSDDLAVVDRRLGPYVGSDHFPLILDVAPAAAKNSATQGIHASTSSR